MTARANGLRPRERRVAATSRRHSAIAVASYVAAFQQYTATVNAQTHSQGGGSAFGSGGSTDAATAESTGFAIGHEGEDIGAEAVLPRNAPRLLSVQVGPQAADEQPPAPPPGTSTYI